MNAHPTKRCSRIQLIEYVLCLALTQCSPTHSGIGFETTTEHSREEAHPPGIVVDPVSELPVAQREGQSAQGVVVLQLERGPAAAADLVRRFLDAVVRENAAELRDLLDSNAVFRRTFSAQGEDALSIWLGRFNQLDYGAAPARRITGRQLLVYSASDLTRQRGNTPSDLAEGEFAVLFKPGGATKELFGSELWFVVGQRGDALRITQFVEDFPRP